jgi:hypothetical protein
MRREKRVENRQWPTAYRGALLIHAGKSREWLELDDQKLFDEFYNIPLAQMQFGFIIGVAQLRGCIHWNRGIRPYPVIMEAWPWLPNHEHTEGPFCWILEDAFRFSVPVPWRGFPGLFDVPSGQVAVGLSEAMEARKAVRR